MTPVDMTSELCDIQTAVRLAIAKVRAQGDLPAQFVSLVSFNEPCGADGLYFDDEEIAGDTSAAIIVTCKGDHMSTDDLAVELVAQFEAKI